MRRKAFRKVLVVWAFILFLLFAYSPVPAQSPKLPPMISMTAYDVGSSGYIQAGAIADALMKKFEVKVRILPSGNDISRTLPLKNRQVQFCLAGVGTYYFAEEGLYDFNALDWGPQRIQAVWNCFPVGGSSLVTAKDAGIKTPTDQKGKRIFWIPGAPAFNITNACFLAFANLTWNDVKKVEFPSYGKALKGIVEGTCDGGFSTGTAATLYELESSRRGIWWPEFSASDVEGWKRLQSVAPYMVPKRNYGGAGQPPGGVQTMTYSYPMLVTYDWQEEDLVYQMTKAIDEGFPLYKGSYPAMANWERKEAIVPGLSLPYHKGSVKYLKEIGVWNQDFENAQKKNLQEQDRLAAAWTAAVAEAKKKGIGASDFPAFWQKKHDEALR
jgi:TRAP transporter TAXI family solute receptor